VETQFGRLLPRSFFGRPADEVAPDLIGRIVVAPDTGVAVRLTEAEAYAGPADPASHAFRRTPRSEVMYGPPGYAYVYFVYGMHWCANIVTGPDGSASAVLLRAADVVDGAALLAAARPGVPSHRLACGPAALARVLGLTGADTGADLIGAGARLELRMGSPERPTVACGPRVGVSVAEDVPWRFFDADALSVSSYRRGTRASRTDARGARPHAGE